MTREQKLALIVGFSLILLVGVLISDHLSRARGVQIAELEADDPVMVAVLPPLPVAVQPVAEREPQEAYLARRDTPAPPAETTVAANDPRPLPMAPVDPIGPGRPPEGDQPIASITMLPQATLDLIAEIRGQAEGFVNGSGLREAPPMAIVTSREPAVSPLPPAPVTITNTTRATEQAPAATTWYTVRQGETLYQISKNLLGSGGRWREIAELNKDRVSADGGVRAGVRILVPQQPGAVHDQGAAPKKAEPRKEERRPAAPSETVIASKPATTYTVQKGDSLGVIAQRALGTVKRKQEILELNRTQIKDENSIRVGMVLTMPAR